MLLLSIERLNKQKGLVGLRGGGCNSPIGTSRNSFVISSLLTWLPTLGLPRLAFVCQSFRHRPCEQLNETTLCGSDFGKVLFAGVRFFDITHGVLIWGA